MEKDKNGSSKFANWSHKRNQRFNRCGRIRGPMRLAVSVFHFPHIIKFKIISCSFNKLSSEHFINEMRFISFFMVLLIFYRCIYQVFVISWCIIIVLCHTCLLFFHHLIFLFFVLFFLIYDWILCFRWDDMHK